MNLTNLAEPTTIIGLAGLAIVSIIYISVRYETTMTQRDMKHYALLEEKDKNYQTYVTENNHQKTEIFEQMLDMTKENTKVMVGVGENIRQNTESIKQLVDIHLKK